MSNQYDLVVVGTGFASTFFLKKYLSKPSNKNRKVLVLERGHFHPHAARVKELRGEATPSQGLNPDHGETFINKNPEKHWPFTIGFGGSSNCWYGCTPRFLPSDFQLKARYGVGMDWPITYEDIEPYYSEAEDLMNISGPDETMFPKTKKYPLPQHKFNTVDKLLKKRYPDLYFGQPTARASQPIHGRNACCVSASCSVCPVSAKFTVENSGFGVYEDERVAIVYGAQVKNLDIQNRVVKQVLYKKDGEEKAVSGEVVALGANAIFNAHILLHSDNVHPLTGRGLGEQYGMDVIVHLKDLNNVGGSTWVTANGYMLYDGDHRKEYAACLVESNNAPYVRLESGKWRQLATFRMVFEDLPDDAHHIAKGKDDLIPEVHFLKPSDYTLKAVEVMKKNFAKVFDCLPIEEIKFLEPYKTESHILGTTRMSRDRNNGVIDQHLIHHDFRNLFVLGSGSFTTFSPNNPTLTLSALSLRSADQSF